ncbi:gypsy/ty3 retroelement polyprotein [Tanacetum coccineum]|uniref:Gypsy/ty3 retroelement polyprotein n=1 Tax=Tanacetum coccineum TaxID=301880 RepID=A0ABQ5HWJ7_9ASTR
MAPATRSIAGTSNNEDGGVNERLRFLEEALAQVTRAMQEMVTMNQGGSGNGRNQNQNQFTRMTKVEFPKFSWDDVKGWIFRCEQFFSIDDIPENQKVKLISVHLFDTTLLWHKQFIILNGENVSWNVYKTGILQWFGTVYDDHVSKIRKIKYQTNAKDYQDAFDTLFSRVDISEEHAVSFYLGGLPAEIEMGVRMFSPKTLAHAYSLTNYQEATLEVVKKKNKTAMTSYGSKFSGGIGQSSSSKPSLLGLPASNSSWKPKPNTSLTTPVRKQLTQKEYQEKRAQNLCFYCDQKYTPGHKCSGQLYLLMVVPKEEEGFFEVGEGMEDTVVQNEIPQISLNALNGSNTFQTMTVTRKVGKHKIHILVDCDSTHNFLDANVAKKIGCQLTKTCPLAVAVGGYGQLINDSECKDFVWQLQGDTFVTDMMILPLGGCEMVLGI